MHHPTKQRAVTIILVCCTFAFFMVFFTRIHPMVIFDTDSWYYAYYHRHAWPVWHLWNPIRVFSEVFMPAVSQFSAYVIYPITGDYFFSLTIGYAFVVSAAVTLLTWMVMRHFQREGSGPFEYTALTLLFLICHFLILRSKTTENKYMLLTDIACTYFYYVLPNLLNCTLVMWLMDDEKLLFFFSPKYLTRKSIFLLAAYFCIFSNVWGSIITAVYAGLTVLIAVISTSKKEKGWFGELIKKYAILIILLVLWALSQWFEINGGRANQIKSIHLWESIKSTLMVAKSVLISVSYPFRWMTLIVLAGGIGVTAWRKRWSEMKLALYGMIAALLIAIYLVLSCAMAGSQYIARPDTFYGLFFCIMLVILVSLRQLLRHLPRLKIIVPLCLVVLACECNTASVTYLNSNWLNMPAETCYQVNNDILQQLQNAIAAGKSNTVVYIPQFDFPDNLPLATYGDKRFPRHLYKMGLLKKAIKVTEVIPTKDKNKEFNIK